MARSNGTHRFKLNRNGRNQSIDALIGAVKESIAGWKQTAPISIYVEGRDAFLVVEELDVFDRSKSTNGTQLVRALIIGLNKRNLVELTVNQRRLLPSGNTSGSEGYEWEEEDNDPYA